MEVKNDWIEEIEKKNQKQNKKKLRRIYNETLTVVNYFQSPN